MYDYIIIIVVYKASSAEQIMAFFYLVGMAQQGNGKSVCDGETRCRFLLLDTSDHGMTSWPIF